jgi:hypothetical protein
MSIADEIAKLDELRTRRILSDAEFETQKQALLKSSTQKDRDMPRWEAIPLRQKWWFQAILYLLALPIGILFIILCPSYQKRRGRVVQVGKGTKVFMVILGLLVWGLNVQRLFQ